MRLALLAEVAFATGNNAEALRYLHHLYLIEPQNPRVQISLAKALFLEGNYTDALDIVEQLIKNKSLDEDPYLLKASILFAMRNPPASMEIVDQVLQRSPNNIQALDTKMRMLILMSQYQEALEVCDKLLKLIERTPGVPKFTHVGVLVRQAALRLKLKQYEEAFHSINRALKEDPHSPEATYIRGLLIRTREKEIGTGVRQVGK